MTERFRPPWDQPAWKAEVSAWITRQLSEHGYMQTAALESIHARVWSTVLRVPTDRGLLFFKAGGPTQAFEPALLQLLNEQRPQDVLPLVAVDVERGWTLLPDGGKTLRQVLDGKVDTEAWKSILGKYAELQLAASEWSEQLLATGIPDHRLRRLPNYYTKILTDPEMHFVGNGEDDLSEAQYQRLLNAAPTVAAMCAELAGFGVPASVEHGDLHDANVFVLGDGYRIFDWGDGSLTHPFFTLIIPLRNLAHKLQLSEYDAHPELIALRDAYLRPWQALAPQPKLLQAWELAHHLAKFARTLNWYRLLKTSAPELVSEHRGSVSGWFQEFVLHPTERF